MKILLIDNFDSFSYNVVDELEKRGAEVLVYRNDVGLSLLVQVAKAERPKLLVVSPGPATPAKAGVCLEAVRYFSARIPVFGICLGHQVIIEAFGGVVGRAPVPVHGKAGSVKHDGKGVFAGLPNPLKVGRYHSLVGVKIPGELEVCGMLGDLVMAVRHRKLPVTGVQFHPESILTPAGGLMVDALLEEEG